MSSKMKSITLKCLLIIAIFALCGSRVLASASVNVPLSSPLYGDIETLSACGLIESDLSSSRPFTRVEAGRMLAEAIRKRDAMETPPTGGSLLNGLIKKYREEISEAEMEGTAPSTYLKPIDELSISYNFMEGPFSQYNNEGIDYFDGSNTMIQFQSRARLWNVFSFYIQPMFIYNQKYNGIDGNNETKSRLHKGYIKLTVDNFEIEVGRDSLWWGPGYHGALLMSNNARPFDMIKLSNPRATLLPWIFSYLGPFRYNLFFSELDDDADSGHPPNSKLLGLRLDFKPHPLLELGVSHLCHFGGDRPGIDSLDFSDYLNIMYSNEPGEGGAYEKRDSNKEFAVDAAVTIPNIHEILPVADSIKLYTEWGGECSGYPPVQRAYIFGMALNDIFMVEGLKFRVEYSSLCPDKKRRWYEHYWSMKHHGRIFGHHAGTDSDDLFLELSQDIREKFSYKIGFDRERRLLDSSPDTETRDRWFIEAECDVAKKVNLTVKYSYEDIDNFSNIKDCTKENHFVGTELTFTF